MRFSSNEFAVCGRRITDEFRAGDHQVDAIGDLEAHIPTEALNAVHELARDALGDKLVVERAIERDGGRALTLHDQLAARFLDDLEVARLKRVMLTVDLEFHGLAVAVRIERLLGQRP